MTSETGMIALALIELFNIFGGYLFDATGSYHLMWMLTIAMGVLAAILNWPIDDRQIMRPVAQSL